MNQRKSPNRLIEEKSPYLLQHAYNPVDWYPWGEEALKKAKQEDKPIFLSIGYSTCHWCHVMERESFLDPQVAELLNQYFVPIKVDREERPDLDHLYMTVCQALTGQGGWPLNVFLTPSQKPFFAGTYFPKEDRYGRTGFIKLLTSLQRLWAEEREKAESMGTKVISQLEKFLDPTEKGTLDQSVIDHGYEQLARQFDEIYGGFGDAPKFPRPHDLLFLLRYSKIYREPEAERMVYHTLRQMRKGGIFDHLGYGFARYSVDREWLVPHFEKMLYDQALLALAYLEAYQKSLDPFFAQVAEEIFAYVEERLRSSEGGFFTAEDADSEGEEGKFYVFDPQEIQHILKDPKDAGLFCKCFGISEEGNFESGKSVLNQINVNLPEIAKEYQLSVEELQKKLEDLRQQLKKARERRVRPLLDDKCLTSWNAMMIIALARASRVLGNTDYLDRATKAFLFLRSRLCREDGRLLARYRDGDAAVLGYLDDYAYFVWAATELYEASFDWEYLQLALKVQEEMFRLFADREKGGFFDYGEDAEQLIARPKQIFDGAVPSGNSVAFYNLVRLAKWTADEKLLKEAERQAEAFGETIKASPISHTFYLVGLLFWLGPSKEVVLRGSPTSTKTKSFIFELNQHYLPDAVLSLFPEGNASTKTQFFLPLVDNETKTEDTVVYICENFACQAPIQSLEKLREVLSR